MAAAEMLAIAVAVGGGATDGIRVAVAIALVVAVFGFGFAILVPWAVRFHRDGQTHWLLGTVLGIVFLATFAWGSVLLMESALEGSRGATHQTRLIRATDEVERAYLEWSQAAIAAYADHRISRLERHELALFKRREAEARRQEFAILTRD